MKYANELLREIRASKNIIVYGAGSISAVALRCLQSKVYDIKVLCCAVSRAGGNPMSIEGVPVYPIAQLKRYAKDSLALVAVMDVYFDSIMATLQRYGFKRVIPLTFESCNWNDIRANYVMRYYECQGIPYLCLSDELQRVRETGVIICPKNVQVYMACCHVDRPLKNPPESRPSYILPLQVGKCFTEQSVAELHDDMGENISAKNKQYCELTALYWIWKNATAKYVGLCHYRRWFDISQEEAGYLSGSDVDVVLTTPILNFPDVKTVYFRDHEEHDWQVMMDVLQEFAPEYYETACASFSGIYYYPYNMLIAKKEIFDAYCNWLFPLLEKIEERCSEKRDIYQNRYMGFLAERLLSLYFVQNRRKYRIYHVAKKFFL